MTLMLRIDPLAAAEESFRDLERMPLMGSSREFKNSALQGIRMWALRTFPDI
jgi:hypothetical protein